VTWRWPWISRRAHEAAVRGFCAEIKNGEINAERLSVAEGRLLMLSGEAGRMRRAVAEVVEDMTANGLATERPTAEDRDRWWRALMAIGYTREEGQ